LNAQLERKVNIKVVGVDFEHDLENGKLPQNEENYSISFQNEDYLACKKSIIMHLKQLERSKHKDAGHIEHTSKRAHEIERAWVRGSYLLVKCGH